MHGLVIWSRWSAQSCSAGSTTQVASVIAGMTVGAFLFGQAALVFCDQVPRLAMLSFPVKFPLRHAATQQRDG